MTALEFVKLEIDPQLGDHLGKNMYKTNEDAIDEFLQNAFDAGATNVEVWINDKEIVVEDNGTGFSPKDIVIYGTIGTRHKQGKKFEGSKGIGRFAGWKLGKTIVVHTRNRKDECYKFELDREDFFARHGFYPREEMKESIGTKIIISGLYNPIYFTQEILEGLRNQIIRDRMMSGRTILLNGAVLTPEQIVYDPNFKKQINKVIHGIHISGELGLASRACLFNGILIRAGDTFKPTGGPYFFGLENKEKYVPFLSRIRGVITVPVLNDKINSSRNMILECQEKSIVFDYLRTELVCLLDEKVRQAERKYEQMQDRELRELFRTVNQLLKEMFPPKEAVRKMKELVEEGFAEDIDNGDEMKVTSEGDTHHGPQVGDNGSNGGIKVDEDPLMTKKKSKGHLRLFDLNYTINMQPLGPDERLIVVNRKTLCVTVNMDHPCFPIYKLPKGRFFLVLETIYATALTEQGNEELRSNIDQIMRKMVAKEIC